MHQLSFVSQLSRALLTKTLKNGKIMHIVVTNDSSVRFVINTLVMICKCATMNAVKYNYIFLSVSLPAYCGFP